MARAEDLTASHGVVPKTTKTSDCLQPGEGARARRTRPRNKNVHGTQAIAGPRGREGKPKIQAMDEVTAKVAGPFPLAVTFVLKPYRFSTIPIRTQPIIIAPKETPSRTTKISLLGDWT